MGYGGKTLSGPETRWKAPRGELFAMAFAARKCRKRCAGREVVLHTDHIAWSDLKVKVQSRVLQGYLMDILELAPTGVYVKGVLNTVADTISRLATNLPVAEAMVGAARVLVPEDLRQELLREVHEGAVGGHFGRSSMLKALSLRYKWPGMAEDIENYECVHCNLYKNTGGRYTSTNGRMQMYNCTRAWELVGVDVEEVSDAGGVKHRYLFLVDYFTKFVEAVPMGAKTAEEVVRAVAASKAWDIGIPRAMTGDDDPAFMNSDVFSGFLAGAGVKWVPKDAHHHQGVVERAVQTFKRVLEAKMVEGLPFRRAILAAAGAVNKGHVGATTGYTPHRLVYGDDYVSELQRRTEKEIRRRAKEHEAAASTTSKSREKMAKEYNRDKADLEVNPSSSVHTVL